MRITLILYKQHLGRMFKYNWLARKHRIIPINTNIVERLEEEGVKVEDAKDIAFDRGANVEESPLTPEISKPLSYTLGDKNVLLDGLDQASVLLRTVVHSEQISTLADIPETFVTRDEETAIKRCIAYAHLYDAQQVKLPKRVNPNNKMWNYARDYGVSLRRRFELTVAGLYNKIESRFGPQSSNHRMLVADGTCKTSLIKDGKPLFFEQNIDFLWTTDKKLQPLSAHIQQGEVQFPDLYPADSTISLDKRHIVDTTPEYPIDVTTKYAHPHTAIIYYSPHEVGNLFGEPVTDSQYFARTLTKAFTVAASYAQQSYGPNIKSLPEPVVVQAVQTDGKDYHFGIMQLNSLDLDEGEPNHFWLTTERTPLFEVCDYVKGKPVLTGYSSETFDRLTAFYTNGLYGKVVPHSYYEASIENVTS